MRSEEVARRARLARVDSGSGSDTGGAAGDLTLAAAVGARALARKGILPTRLYTVDEARRLQAEDAFRIEMRDLFTIEIADRQRLEEMDSGRVGLVWPVDGKKNVVGSER